MPVSRGRTDLFPHSSSQPKEFNLDPTMLFTKEKMIRHHKEKHVYKNVVYKKST